MPQAERTFRHLVWLGQTLFVDASRYIISVRVEPEALPDAARSVHDADRARGLRLGIDVCAQHARNVGRVVAAVRCVGALGRAGSRTCCSQATRKFLGFLLRGAQHITQAVKHSLSQVRIDMARETRSVMGSIPMGVGRLSKTR